LKEIAHELQSRISYRGSERETSKLVKPQRSTEKITLIAGRENHIVALRKDPPAFPSKGKTARELPLETGGTKRRSQFVQTNPYQEGYEGREI